MNYFRGLFVSNNIFSICASKEEKYATGIHIFTEQPIRHSSISAKKEPGMLVDEKFDMI